MSLPDAPNTLREKYYSVMAGQNDADILPNIETAPNTENRYLDYIARNGGGGGGDVTKEYVDNAIATAVADKVDKVEGKGLSTNDYTNADKALVQDSPISSTSTTSPLTDSADGYVQGVTVYGRSEVVEGEIKSVGDDGLTVTTANSDNTVTTSAEFTTALPLRSTLDGTTRDELIIGNGKAEAITRCEVVDDNIVPLATPVTTPLTDAEISAFRGLKTYDSTTNITITDSPDFEIDYLKNTENGQAVADIQTDLQGQIDDKITVSPPLTLTVAGWDSTTLQQTVTFVHDTTKRNVIDVDPASVEEWAACGVLATAETANNITFSCKSVPANALSFKVTSMGV